MKKDPIVEEVRSARETYAKKFGYDLKKIAQDLRKKAKNSGTLSGSPQTKPPRKATNRKGHAA